MDSELARTFLTIVSTGNFTTAAELLHVTQSTVSARIRTLEDILGCSLFVRNKGGTALTPQGVHFQKYAMRIVQSVEQAKQDIGIPAGFSGALKVGARFGLWEGFLQKWVQQVLKELPSVMVRAETGYEDDLMQKLVDSRLDIGVMYTPQSRPGFRVEQLFDEHLVMASTRPINRTQIDGSYVYIDWGPEFYQRHEMNFPGLHSTGLVAGVGWIGLHHILDVGGIGYFPIRALRPHIAKGHLHVVHDAPEFLLPVYAVYSTLESSHHLEQAIKLIRDFSRRTI
jgi:DNA-binding transcriptional LysR family regulator